MSHVYADHINFMTVVYLVICILQSYQRQEMYSEAAEEKSLSNSQNQAEMQSDGFAQLLYANRSVNDKLFADIIKQAAQNSAVEQQLQKQKSKLPSIVRRWCADEKGVKNMGAFMSQFSRLLDEQISSMTDRLSNYKKEKELLAIEHQRQAEQQTSLTHSISAIQKELKMITLQNNEQEQELKRLYAQQKIFVGQLQEQQQRKHFLSMEREIEDDQRQRIAAATKVNLYEDAEYKYFSELTSLINHIHQRQLQIKNRQKQMNEEIEKLNKLIDELREEKEGAQRKRGEIVSKHRQLLTLKAELAKAQEKRAKAVKEKNALEQKYCENYMTEVVACYHGLDEKYNCLVGRTMNLIKTACASLDIKEVSRRIEELNQQ